MRWMQLPDTSYALSRGPATAATDEATMEKAEAAASLRADQRLAIERVILGNPQGREWIWQLLSDCHVWEKRISVTGEHENGFFEGQREVGLQLMRRLAKSAPADFARMFTENDR
jgi:hypothetical protein